MIGALGRGGAERQLMRLAAGLRAQACEVEVWCYTGDSPLDSELRDLGIKVRTPAEAPGLAKRARVQAWLADFQPDVLHCFMKRASSLGVLARGFSPRPVVIGSDLSTATYGKRDFALFSSLLLFRFCNVVATQTELNRRSLQRLAPWLRGRVRVVRNGLDLARFTPSEAPRAPGPLRFVCVGSVYAVKNPLRVVQAAAALQRAGLEFRIDWYGRLGLGGDHAPSEDYHACQALLAAEDLGQRVVFHGERADIIEAYRQADVLLHASVQEGFPNAVVEGMACALPVVVSRVSDLPLVVEQADNGFVFDETDPAAIAAAMRRMLELSADARREMGQRSRELAERWFGLQRFVDEYLALYRELLAAE